MCYQSLGLLVNKESGVGRHCLSVHRAINILLRLNRQLCIGLWVIVEQLPWESNFPQLYFL